MKALPTYFLSHGGGPWPWMEDQRRSAYGRLEDSLKKIPQELSRTPKAVLVITAHWEAADFSIQASVNPGMIYDYGGFPAHTYSIQYPAPGSSAVALRAFELIQSAGLAPHLDPQRGYDHGTFVPLYAMYPEARVPIVQVSIREDYDPEAHFKLGRALAPLREEDVLIVGSGLTYHNLRDFGPGAKTVSATFDQWLNESLALPPEARHSRLMQWALAPAARQAHPQEDHFLPLLVAVGAAENESAERIYFEDDFMGGVSVSSYRFGAP